MRQYKLRLAGIACLAAALVGCHGGDSIGGSTTTPNASIVGLWNGTDSDNPGLAYNVIIDSAGDMVAIRSDGVQFVGTLQISGDSVAASLAGYANFGASFPDRSIYGIGTLSGTVNPGTSIAAMVAFTTNGGTSLPGDWTLTPNALTDAGSSLNSVNGTFTDSVTGATVVISAAGVMSSQDANTGCTLTGTIGTSDTSLDEYQVSYTLANCSGDYAVLIGVPFAGLGYLDTTVSPATLTYAVAGTSSNGSFGIVSVLNGT
jgi:hypothetical protein